MNDRISTTPSTEAVHAALSAAAGAIDEIRDILSDALATKVMQLAAAATAEIAKAQAVAAELGEEPVFYDRRCSYRTVHPFYRVKGFNRQAWQMANRYAELRPEASSRIAEAAWSAEPAP